MRTLARTSLLAASLLAAGLAIPVAAGATPPAQPLGVVFVANDALDGNTVVAYDRAADGTLTQAGSYATGGLGGQLNGSAVDHIASQGGLTADRAHRELFAVNAGSDTLSTFRIHGDRLTRSQLVPTDGSFPVSVTVHGAWVWVLNARDGGSLQGYVNVARHLYAVAGWHRDLHLPPAAPEFTHTPGQVAFTPDGRHLIVTTKAGSDSVLVYGVGRFGALTGRPATLTQPGTVPFAVTFDRFGHLAVSQAGTSQVITYDIAPDGSLTALGSTATGQPATCWVTAAGKYLVASNTGGASLTAISTSPSGQTAAVATASTAGGPVDSAYAPNGSNLYVQTGATGELDEFSVGAGGSLTGIGTVVVPDAAGGEGIVAW